MNAAKYLTIATASIAVAAPALADDPARAAPADDRSAFEVALGAPAALRISGSIRPRYESLTNTFVAGQTGSEELLSLRTRLRAEFDAGPLTLTAELQDARWLDGDAGSRAPGQTDALELVQAFASWTWKDAVLPGATLKTDLGRFTMDVGSRRLVARSNFGNVLQGFDGVRAVWKGAAEPGSSAPQITLLAVSPTRREPSDMPSLTDNEVALNSAAEGIRFLGAHAQTPGPFGAVAEVYAFDLDERDRTSAPSRNRDLVTVGARLAKAAAPGDWDFDVELAHQTGSMRASTSALDTVDLDHEASMLHLEGGFSFLAPLSTRISLLYDFASGDKSPTDNKSGRFDPLFGDRSFELGPTSIWGLVARGNLSSAGVQLEIEPDEMSDVLVMLRQIDLAEARDVFASTGVVDASGASGRQVGQQLEVRYRRWLAEDSVRLAIGGALLIEGDFLKSAPNATGKGNAVYGYSEISWMF